MNTSIPGSPAPRLADDRIILSPMMISTADDLDSFPNTCYCPGCVEVPLPSLVRHPVVIVGRQANPAPASPVPSRQVNEEGNAGPFPPENALHLIFN